MYEGLHIRKGSADRSMVRDALYEDYPFAELKDHVVLDCGAHIGAFVKRAVDARAKFVFAVEPWEPNLLVLKKNFDNHPRVKILPVAVASVPSVTLTAPSDSATGGVSAFINHRSPTQQQSVKALTLEELIRGTGATFLKLDIEAAEYDVLPCDLGDIQHICGELHTMSRKNRRRAFELFIWLEEQGFYVTYIKPGPQRSTGKMFERILWLNFHAQRRKVRKARRAPGGP